MSEATKDFFRLHEDIMSQYKSFANSLVDIDDPQILKELKSYGDQKSMWPNPLIQFNPIINWLLLALPALKSIPAI